jgi:hypothetical protein
VIREETRREPGAVEVKKVKAEEARRQRAAVAGFDLVFSPVKSAALLWAVDDRPWVRGAVREAHEAAMREALHLVEEHAAFTRTGHGGIAQVETNGLIAAAFEHWDSRAGDPNLHTHVAVSSKVQGTDGKWRALDARALYRITVAVSEAYNTGFEAHLSARLGVTFTAWRACWALDEDRHIGERGRLAELVVLVRGGTFPHGLECDGALVDDHRVAAQPGVEELAGAGEVVEPSLLAVEHPVVVGRQQQSGGQVPRQPADILSGDDTRPGCRVLEPDVVGYWFGDDPRPADLHSAAGHLTDQVQPRPVQPPFDSSRSPASHAWYHGSAGV